jgi:hypothetical protein
MTIADPSYVSRKAVRSDTMGDLFLPVCQKAGTKKYSVIWNLKNLGLNTGLFV